jgi:hypothetical protein
MYLYIKGTLQEEWGVMYLYIKGNVQGEWGVMYLYIKGTMQGEYTNTWPLTLLARYP